MVPESVRVAAIAAARLHIDGRPLGDSIDAAAKEHGVNWISVTNYLLGYGARAMLLREERVAGIDFLSFCENALAAVAQHDEESTASQCARDEPTPAGWLTHGMVRDCADARDHLTAVLGMIKDLEDASTDA